MGQPRGVWSHSHGSLARVTIGRARSRSAGSAGWVVAEGDGHVRDSPNRRHTCPGLAGGPAALDGLVINHFSFHIMDPRRAHLTIKMSGHPPFGAHIILNGHQYVACQAQVTGIGFTKEAGTCFTAVSDPAHLTRASGARLTRPANLTRPRS